MKHILSHRRAGRSSQTLSTSQGRTAPSFSLLPPDALLSPPLSRLPIDLDPRISEAQPPRCRQVCLHQNSEEISTPVITNKRTEVEQGPCDWASLSLLESFDSTTGFTSWFDQNRAAHYPRSDSGNWQLATGNCARFYVCFGLGCLTFDLSCARILDTGCSIPIR